MELTPPQIVAAVKGWGNVDDTPEANAWLTVVLNQMNGWLGRGDGIAMYENQDLGHPDLGDKRYVSYGSPAAQLETSTPPTQLPDGIGGTINWRYVLIGTYRGTEPLTDTEA